MFCVFLRMLMTRGQHYVKFAEVTWQSYCHCGSIGNCTLPKDFHVRWLQFSCTRFHRNMFLNSSEDSEGLIS